MSKMRGFLVERHMDSSQSVGMGYRGLPGVSRRSVVVGACALLGLTLRAPDVTAQAAATEPLLVIKRKLKPFETLQGKFEQEKKLAKIKKPLKSRGSFALQRGRGVLWRTEAPLESLLAMTRDAISIIKDGKTVTSISLTEQPGLRVMGRVVFAVFSADTDEIKRSFDVTASQVSEQSSSWSVSLKPKDAGFAKVVRSIQLHGAEYLETLEIAETNGDSTLIRFQGFDTQSKLRAEDARLLEASTSKK